MPEDAGSRYQFTRTHECFHINLLGSEPVVQIDWVEGVESSANSGKQRGGSTTTWALNTPTATGDDVQVSEAVISDVEDLRRIVGRNIRLAREGRQMSQGELADRLDAGEYRVISGYEKGRVLPKQERLIKIAIVLERDLAWFYEPHHSEKNGRAA